LGSLTAASWVSFDFNVSYSSWWGYSLINTLKLKKKNWKARLFERLRDFQMTHWVRGILMTYWVCDMEMTLWVRNNHMTHLKGSPVRETPWYSDDSVSSWWSHDSFKRLACWRDFLFWETPWRSASVLAGNFSYSIISSLAGRSTFCKFRDNLKISFMDTNGDLRIMSHVGLLWRMPEFVRGKWIEKNFFSDG